MSRPSRGSPSVQGISSITVKITASLALLGGVLLLAPAAAGAATIGVTSTDDNKTDDQLCTLREAVDAAVTNAVVNPSGGNDCPAGDSAIADTVSMPAGTYNLSGTGDDTNVTGDLDITGGGVLTVQGAAPVGGAPVVFVDMNDLDRAFDIPVANQVTLILRNLEVDDGSVGGTSDGGAVRVLDPDGVLVAENVRFVSNHAGGDGGAIAFTGGDTDSKLNLATTEFSGNTAGLEGGAVWLDMPDDFEDPLIDKSAFVGNGAGTMGGAIYVETRASDGPVLVVRNSTVSGNTAQTGGGALAFDQDEGGNVYFRFATIAGNSTPAAGQGGGVLTNLSGLNGQFVLFSDSIVAANTAAGAASNCDGDGDYGSTGYNIDSGGDCFSPSGTDLVNTNPLIAPLALTPGLSPLFTPTHGLYNESPAVNRIPEDDCDFANDSRDQRFVTRTDGFCDVGAFEGTVGPAPATPSGGSPPAANVAPTPLPPATKCKKKKKKRSAAVAKKKKCKKKRK